MYVNAALSAVVEIPSCLIVMPLFKKLGRPLSCFLTLFLGSMALICTAMVPAGKLSYSYHSCVNGCNLN